MVEKLDKDMIEAMKSKDKDRLVVIRMVKAALKQEQIDHKKEINDDLLIDVVNKQIKMRKDSITEFEKGNRTDLVEKTQKEIADVLNTTYQYYSAYERGVRDIPSHHIKTLAQYYNISADYLLGLTDEPRKLK